MIEVPVFGGDTIGAGAEIAGPAVIEDETFTALLLPRHRAVVDSHGNYLVTVEREAG